MKPGGTFFARVEMRVVLATVLMICTTTTVPVFVVWEYSLGAQSVYVPVPSTLHDAAAEQAPAAVVTKAMLADVIGMSHSVFESRPTCVTSLYKVPRCLTSGEGHGCRQVRAEARLPPSEAHSAPHLLPCLMFSATPSARILDPVKVLDREAGGGMLCS